MPSRTIILAAVLTSHLLLSQTFTATLKIDLENVVGYQITSVIHNSSQPVPTAQSG